jgi:hypothetical protein
MKSNVRYVYVLSNWTLESYENSRLHTFLR